MGWKTMTNGGLMGWKTNKMMILMEVSMVVLYNSHNQWLMYG